MKIEILYPELCTLYGDKGNMQYLKLCLPDAEFVETTLNAKPLFLTEDIDLVYMCSMSEKSQEVILSRLLPLKEEIFRAFDAEKTVFFFVGNALELLGKYIKREDGSKVEALAYLNSYSSRFSHTFGIPEQESFCKVEMGTGMNPKSVFEGIRKGKILATYMLGPILVANPDFTHYLLRMLGADMEKIPYEDAMRDAYNQKMKEFEKPDLELS